MITQVEFHRFKKFKDRVVEIRPSVVLLAGGNNSGKTSLMQGLAIWEFCRTVLEMERGKSSLCAGASNQGLGLGGDEFSPVNIPSLKHLWTNLKTQRQGEADGYTLWVKLTWLNNNGDTKRIKLGMSLANDRLFVKTIDSNVTLQDDIPRIAYIPPFAGIVDREQRHTTAIRRKLIGQGLSGGVIRNILLDMYEDNQGKRSSLKRGTSSKISRADLKSLRENDRWEILQSILERIFKIGITVYPFNDLYHSYIRVECFKGNTVNNRFQRLNNYTTRDLMVEGSGFLQWLGVFALSLDPDNKLLMLDEPDAHLHPSLQKELIDELEKISKKFDKQILFASHSPDLIRSSPPSTILEFRDGKPRYLVEDLQKVALLNGIGSEFAPKINNLQLHKRLIFVENPSDIELLSILAQKLGAVLPSNHVIWQYLVSHDERKKLFTEIAKEIPDLRGISLRDRDDESLGTTSASLEDFSHPDIAGRNLFCRKWRRRYIESYLLSAPAIARAASTTAEVIIRHIAEHFAIDLSNSYIAQDEPEAILDARAKTILWESPNSIKTQFNVTKHDIARQMNFEDVPADIHIMIAQIVGL